MQNWQLLGLLSLLLAALLLPRTKPRSLKMPLPMPLSLSVMPRVWLMRQMRLAVLVPLLPVLSRHRKHLWLLPMQIGGPVASHPTGGARRASARACKRQAARGSRNRQAARGS